MSDSPERKSDAPTVGPDDPRILLIASWLDQAPEEVLANILAGTVEADRPDMSEDTAVNIAVMAGLSLQYMDEGELAKSAAIDAIARSVANGTGDARVSVEQHDGHTVVMLVGGALLPRDVVENIQATMTI